MPVIDRSKLKGTNLKTLKDQDKETYVKTSGRDSRPGFVNLDEGQNKLRIYPAHPDCESFIYPKVIHWIPQEMDEYDGNEKTGNKEIKDRPIFNSKVHGGTEKDIVDEYVLFVKKMMAAEVENANELEEILKPLYPKKDGKGGLMSSTKWICYVDKYLKSGAKEFGRIELTGGVKNKLNELAAKFESAEDASGSEPFTDCDEGIAVIITYDPDAKDKTGNKDFKKFYTVDLEETVGKFKTERVPTPLTDIDLEAFLAQESLEKIYKNSYKRSDFTKALMGLEIFDKKNGYSAFQHDEWADVVAEIDAYYPEDNNDEEATKAFDKKTTLTKSSPKVEKEKPVKVKKEKVIEKPVVAEKEVELEPEIEDEIPDDVEKEIKGDEFTSMDRTALKVYIKKQNFPIAVRANWADDEIRDMIRQHIEPEPEVTSELQPNENFDEKEVAVEKKIVVKEEKKTEEKVEITESVKDKLAAMRAKMKK